MMRHAVFCSLAGIGNPHLNLLEKSLGECFPSSSTRMGMIQTVLLSNCTIIKVCLKPI